MLLISLGAACRPAARGTTDSGRLDLEWTGSDPGRISGPATAEWCATRRMLEVRAVQSDTGVALALYPGETLAAGEYRVVDPVKAESVPPSAGVALRWFAENAVKGFQGNSGTVTLERSKSGQLSGDVIAEGRSVVDTQEVAITGTFRDLNVRRQSRGCAAPPGGTGIH